MKNKDVDEELKEATEYWLDKESIGYDLSVISQEQKPKRTKYAERMRDIKVD